MKLKLEFMNGKPSVLEGYMLWYKDCDYFDTKKEAMEVGEKYKEHLPRFKDEVKVKKVQYTT